MPTNVTAEYGSAEQEYQKASAVEDKIKALEKMLSTAPTHKGTEKLRQDIKTKLAKFRKKLKKETEKKAKGFSISIKKEGSATIVLVGPANSGKSTLLNKLTNSKAKVADYEFTTQMPEVGIMKYKGLKLQVIEIPAITEDYHIKGKGPQFLSIMRSADLVVIVTDSDDIDILFKEFELANIKINEQFHYEEDDSIAYLNGIIVATKKDLGIDVYQGLCRYYNFKIIPISCLDDKDIEMLKDKMWSALALIKIHTKEPGKKVSKDEPLCLKKGSTIKDMAKHIHKDFIRKFRYARVWGKSAKFGSQQVGLDHKLKDDDIVELHLK